ncbi:MAG: hypothetical protein AAFW81_04320 [Pseudomonadota bacterium]
MKTKNDKPQDDEQVTIDLEAPQAMDSLAASIGARNLMIIIVTMPLVFLVVVMAIIGIFGNRDAEEIEPVAARTEIVRSTPVASLSEPLAPGVVAPTAAAAAAANAISLPAGAEIGSMALDGDRLALRVDGPDGEAVVIYDLANGAVVQIIPVLNASSER